jgi:hypothetical protein
MSGPQTWSFGGVAVTLCDVFETVDDLTSAVTAIVSPDGPLGTLTKTLTDALDGVWAGFFSSPTPPGGTNWNAYTHEQLYNMLWEGADVGDVSTVAAEWGRHGTALTEFADALRSQGQALPSSWRGQSAELAEDRLLELSDRIWNVGARAGTVEKATNDAADALALARKTMPKPPPDPMTLATSAVGAGPMDPVSAVLVGGARIFTADATAGVSKAQAVQVMQRYETSLRDSGNHVVPGTDGTSRNYDVDGPTSAASASGGLGATGGVPWNRLVGQPGGLVGAGPVQSVLAAESATLSELAARRGMPPGGFLPPTAGRPGEEEDKEHPNRLPSVNNGLFKLDERASDPVIGDLTDRERGSAF